MEQVPSQDALQKETVEEEKVPESEVEHDESEEEKVEEGDIEAENSEESSRSEGSTTDENEELREILQAHENVEVPFIPNAAIIPAGLNLSTIVEERSFDKSITSGLIKTGKSPLLDDVSEEEEAQEPQPETQALEMETEVNTEEPSGSNAHLDTLDAAKVEEEASSTFEPLQPLTSDEETIELTIPKRQRGRPKSSKSGSQVLLPFTSRRSIWDNREDRDRSPESVTSEPPQTFEDIVGVSTKKRTRRHSSSVSSTSSQVVTRRRSTRLSTSITEAPATPVDDEAVSLTPTKALEITPPKSTSKRRSAFKAEQSSAPPSCEVSPSDSIYSERSSAPGTPMRRSARISALRDRTPEPMASTDALLAGIAGRIRRHSSGPGGPDLMTASPLRRSGRKSANVSRDHSPTDSVTSEPPPQSTSRELTPSRRKHTSAKTLLRSAQKSVALNLFPVEEEKETEFQLPEEFQNKVQAGLSYQDLSVAPADSDESISHDEMSITSDTSSVKKQRKPLSRPSSVGSGRYNLRRGAIGRPSELDIISEEAAAAAAAETTASNLKRSRDDRSEDSSDQGEQAGPSRDEPVEEEEGNEDEESSQKVAQPKRVVRNKKRKTANKQEEEDKG